MDTKTRIERHWLLDALNLLRQEQPVVVVSLVGPLDSPGLGSHVLASGTDSGPVHLGGPSDAASLLYPESIVKEVWSTRSARLVTAGGTRPATDARDLLYFVSFYGPPDEVWVFGAGHIARALVPLVAKLGWRAVVCDDRPEFVTKERFPDAHALHVAPFEELASLCASHMGRWAVLVTRGHQHDEKILRRIVTAAPRYVGMIGSKRRIRSVVERLSAEGLPVGFLESIHAPVGLSIGADSPMEIAVSIAAELIAVRRGADARESPGGRKMVAPPADTSMVLPLWEKTAAVLETGKPAVLATIIDRRGSTPRGLGAQMAIFADGTIAGTIGGGCGEEDIRREAMRLLVSGGRPCVIDVDLTGDPASETADVCGGRYSVFLELLSPIVT